MSDTFTVTDRNNLTAKERTEFVKNGVDTTKVPVTEKKQATAERFGRPFVYEKQTKENFNIYNMNWKIQAIN